MSPRLNEGIVYASFMHENLNFPAITAWRRKRANISGLVLDAGLGILLCVLLLMFALSLHANLRLTAARQAQAFLAHQVAFERVRLQQHEIEARQHAEQARRQEAILQATIDVYRDRLNRFVQALIPSGSPLDPVHAVSSGYGYRTHPILRKKKLHRGLDFAVREGSPVRVTADGVVSLASSSASLGKFITVRHAYGFSTLYGHLSRPMVKSGQLLRKGSVLALSGNTGLSTGAHLHYELSYLGKPLDPQPFLAWAEHEASWIVEHVSGVPWEVLFANLPWGNGSEDAS